MAIKQLSQASAYNPGASLWICPDQPNSKWYLKLDWYLNFQISRLEKHNKQFLSKDLETIILKTELDIEKQIVPDEKHTLVSSYLNLPCRWLIVQPYENNPKEWCLKIKHSWQSLKEPSLRVFLPTGLNASDFTEVWRSITSFDDLTVVLD